MRSWTWRQIPHRMSENASRCALAFRKSFIRRRSSWSMSAHNSWTSWRSVSWAHTAASARAGTCTSRGLRAYKGVLADADDAVLARPLDHVCLAQVSFLLRPVPVRAVVLDSQDAPARQGEPHVEPDDRVPILTRRSCWPGPMT
jgi:hypothetical protein